MLLDSHDTFSSSRTATSNHRKYLIPGLSTSSVMRTKQTVLVSSEINPSGSMNDHPNCEICTEIYDGTTIL